MAPPKPKIPAEYANKASAEFSEAMGELAAKLSDNIDSRAVDAADNVTTTLGAAGMFNRTVDGKTPDVKAPTDFEVSMDELLQSFKDPKAVTGGGAKTVSVIREPGALRPSFKYQEGTGVLNGDSTSVHTPKNAWPVPVNLETGYNPRTSGIVDENAMRNIDNTLEERRDPTLPKLFSTGVENIPAVVPPLAVAGAAGIALTANPARAEDKTPPLLKRPAEQTEPVIPPLLKRPEPAPVIPTIKDEIANIAATAAGKVTINQAKVNYDLEKQAIALKAAENSKRYEESTGKLMTDLDKTMMMHTLGVVEGSPYVAVESMASLMHDNVIRFHKEVINPVLHTVQGSMRKEYGPTLEFIRGNAPQLAILMETGLYYQFGDTGWNITDAGADMDTSKMDPIAKKLIEDKTTFIGSDGGAAMMSMVTGYRDLPLWVIGGSSKAGLALGGAANEVVREDGDMARGAALGVGFGIGMQKLMSTKLVQKGISLLGKGGDKFLKFTMGEDYAQQEAIWTLLAKKNNVEPLAIMTADTATMMADNAALKATPDVSEVFKTQNIAPQAIVLDVTEDGTPKIYGSVDGRYGELPSNYKNKERRPVIITQQAKKVWIDNLTLRDNYQRMIGSDRPASRVNGIDEWTLDVIPPENPALVFAWKNGADDKGMMEVYRAGSHQFNADLLRARSLSRVEFDGPDGKPQIGLGYYSPTGVVFAPDPSENIPGALKEDLIMIRQSLLKRNPAGPIDPRKQAWEVRPITDDDTLFGIVDHIKGANELQITHEGFKIRGGKFPDNVPVEAPAAPFDNVASANTTRADRPGLLGGVSTELGGMAAAMGAAGIDSPTALAFGFFALASKREIAKKIMKLPPVAAVARQVLPATAYGEAFKIDAAVQAFSTRHFKRYVPDLTKQLTEEFGAQMALPHNRKALSDEIRSHIMGIRPLPATVAPNVQAKVNAYTNERNADYAMIKMLGGYVPTAKYGIGNPQLETLFARDYVDATEWVKYYDKNNIANDQLKSLLSLPKSDPGGKAIRDSGIYDTALGKLSIEHQMAEDYFQRKAALNTLFFSAELAGNPEASSAMANKALGHTEYVDFENAGMLTGRFVSKDTLTAIHTFPKAQEMTKNLVQKLSEKIKYNRTVLNPGTWAKNIAGNVYGTMMSNIVPAHAMGTQMPRGFRIMNCDLAAYNANLMSNSPAVTRVHESLKFGLLGADFDSTRGELGKLLSELEVPTGKGWEERLGDVYFGTKDPTLTKLGQKYSHIDSATKYALYVNGTERWGINLATNELDTAYGRARAAGILGPIDPQWTDEHVAEMVKRAVVRRIHLSLPMVDRTSPVVTKLSSYAGLFNPYMRTNLELARVTSQMPYRALNEPGYAVNAMKTVALLGAIYAANKTLRYANNITDKSVSDAKKIAPKNITDYMPGMMATMFRASDGGIVVFDAGDMLIESLQWFSGDDKQGIPKRVLVKLLDTITTGGALDNEAKAALSMVGLAPVDKQYNRPVWKQGDNTRGLVEIAAKMGPQFLNNAWDLYSASHHPDAMAMKGQEKLKQPIEIMALKTLGLDVASIGTAKQQDYKLAELRNKRKELLAQKKSVSRQTEGSSTGRFQPTFKYNDAIAKIEKALDELDKEEMEVSRAVSTDKRYGHIKLTK